MEDKEIVGLLWRRIRAAQDGGPDQTYQKKALDYFYGRPRGDEVENRSQIQSLDVADMTNAVLSQILPAFTHDQPCIFEPEGPDDEEQARLETDAVSYVLMEQNRGYVLLYEAIKDALLLKNGIIKAYLEDDDYGRRVRVKTVDPINFGVDEEQDCVILEAYSTFCYEKRLYTRGQLVDMGFPQDKVLRIPDSGSDENSESEQARYRQGSRQAQVDSGWQNDWVDVYECHAMLAMAEDGRAKLYRCLLGGQELLSKERASYVPYAAGSPFPEPHRFWGVSLYDRLKTVQDAKTAIKRQWLDNLANCNNSGGIMNDRINRQEIGDGRPGNKVSARGDGPVQDCYMPLPVQDVGPAAQAFLAYEDQVRADRGGAALQMASAEAQLLGGQVGSQGVDRIYSVQEQLAGMIARTLAETLVRSTFLLVHRVLREEYGETLTVRRADQWVEVNPAEWKPRQRVNIRSGLSPGERSRKAAAMAQVLQMQTMALQMGLGGALVDAGNLYSALMDWASANELDAGSKYFTDPASRKAQMAAAQHGQQQAQMAQIQMQMAQAQMALEGQKLQLDKYKTDTENQIKVWTERLHAEIEEAKIVGAATAELQRVELEGRTALAAGMVQGAGGGNVSGPGGPG